MGMENLQADLTLQLDSPLEKPGREDYRDKVWRAEPGLKVGTPLGTVLNRKGHQGSSRRRASPALHVNEDRVNKG